MAEVANGHGCKPEARASQLERLPAHERAIAELEDVSAWLLINSMCAEKLCFPLWCLQCAQNVWRKRCAPAASNAVARWAVRTAHTLCSISPAQSVQSALQTVCRVWL